MLTPSDSFCQLCETSPTRCTCINNYSTFPLWWKHDNLFTFVKRMLWLSHPALSQNLSKNVEILTNNAQIIINRLGPYHSSFGFKFWARVYGGLNKTRQRNTGQLNFLNFFFYYYLPVRQQSLWCWCDVFSSNYWCSFRDSMILLPLRPASLTYKDSERCKIAYNMRPIGSKEWSTDLKIFLAQYPVHVISSISKL